MAGARSELRTFFGARMERNPYPMPVVVKGLDNDLIEDVLARIQNSFPKLTAQAESVRQTYYARYMTSPIEILKAKDGLASLLIDESYEELQKTIKPLEFKVLMLFQIASLLGSEIITRKKDKLTAQTIHAGLANLVVQTLVYYSLQKEEQIVLHELAQKLDRASGSTRHEPVLAAIEQFDPTQLYNEMNRRILLELVSHYPGFDKADYSPERLSEYVKVIETIIPVSKRGATRAMQPVMVPRAQGGVLRLVSRSKDRMVNYLAKTIRPERLISFDPAMPDRAHAFSVSFFGDYSKQKKYRIVVQFDEIEKKIVQIQFEQAVASAENGEDWKPLKLVSGDIREFHIDEELLTATVVIGEDDLGRLEANKSKTTHGLADQYGINWSLVSDLDITEDMEFQKPFVFEQVRLAAAKELIELILLGRTEEARDKLKEILANEAERLNLILKKSLVLNEVELTRGTWVAWDERPGQFRIGRIAEPMPETAERYPNHIFVKILLALNDEGKDSGSKQIAMFPADKLLEIGISKFATQDAINSVSQKLKGRRTFTSGLGFALREALFFFATQELEKGNRSLSITKDISSHAKDVLEIVHTPDFGVWRISGYQENPRMSLSTADPGDSLVGGGKHYDFVLEWPKRGGRDKAQFRIFIPGKDISVPAAADPVRDAFYDITNNTLFLILRREAIDEMQKAGVDQWSYETHGKQIRLQLISEDRWGGRNELAATDILTAIKRLTPPFIEGPYHELLEFSDASSVDIQPDTDQPKLKNQNLHRAVTLKDGPLSFVVHAWQKKEGSTEELTPERPLNWEVEASFGASDISVVWKNGKLTITGALGSTFTLNLESDPFVNVIYDDQTNTLKIILQDNVIAQLKELGFDLWSGSFGHDKGFHWQILSQMSLQAAMGFRQFVQHISTTRRSELRGEKPDYSADEIAAFAEQLKPYYQAKRKLLDAAAARNPDQYSHAFQAMEAVAKRTYNTNPSMALMEKALDVLRGEEGVGRVQDDLLGEPNEIFRAAAQPLGDREHKMIEQVAEELASAISSGSTASEIKKIIIARTRTMALSDLVENSLAALVDPASHNVRDDILKESLYMLAHADKTFWGMTRVPMSDRRISWIVMRPLEDTVLFKVSFLHEAIHLVSELGYLPIFSEHEAITHATTALEMVRARGREGLRRFSGGDDLAIQLFERGEKAFEAGESIEDYDWLRQEVQRLAISYVREKERREAQEKPEDGEAADKEKPQRVVADMDEVTRYYEFERIVGDMLGGYAWAKEQKTGQAGLAYILEYATHVLARTESIMAPLTGGAENQERAHALRSSTLELARTLTRNRHLEVVDWTRTATGSDIPEVRYMPELGKIAVPKDVWFLHEDIVRGLIAQEIMRAIHSKPDVLEDSTLKANRFFMELFRTLETPRVIEAGTKELPGARSWIDKMYSYRHRITNLPFAKRMMGIFPLPFQYLAGIFWLWNRKEIDIRITDERVREALQSTRSDLERAFVSDPNTHFEIVSKIIWPVLEKLIQQAIEDGIAEEVMLGMIQSDRLVLTPEQQQLYNQNQLRQGNLTPGQLEALKKQVSDLSEDELKALREKAEQNLMKFAQSYDEQLGGQPLRGLAIQTAQDHQVSVKQTLMGPQVPVRQDRIMKGLQRFLPKKPSASGSMMGNLNKALQALLKEAEELRKLAEVAEETAENLRKKAKEFNDKAALELAKKLDDYAGQLRQEVQRLNDEAAKFLASAQTAQGSVAGGQSIAGQMGQLVQGAEQLVKQTDALQGQASHLKEQTETLMGQIGGNPELVSPELTGALSEYANQIHQDAGEISQHAQNLQSLTQSLQQALQDAQQGGGSGSGGGGDSGKQPLERLDFTKLDDSQVEQTIEQQRQAGSAGGGGDSGYGKGVSTNIVRKEAKERDPEEVKAVQSAAPAREDRPEKPRKITDTAREVSEHERDLAADVLKEIPKVDLKKAAPLRSVIHRTQVPTHLREYQTVREKYRPQITRLKSDFVAALRQTELGGKLGGLSEGDYLDPDSMAQVKGRPPEIMAVDITPREFNYRIGLLVDLSGSMMGPIMSELDIMELDENPRQAVLNHLRKRITAREEGHATPLQMAAEGAAILLESTNGMSGVQTEIYGFHTTAAIPFKTYDDKKKMDEKMLAHIYGELFNHSGGGTADAAAIALAIERIQQQREAYPGLVIFGIGIGAGLDKVMEAYAPNGYAIDSPEQLPNLIREILRKNLTGKKGINNILIVLTDGNPGANNAAAIQKMAHDNARNWAKPERRSELRASTPAVNNYPFRYVTRQGKQGQAEFLVVGDQAIETGPGGDLVPQIEILQTLSLDLPPPKNEKDFYPAEYVARLHIVENERKQQILVPLSPYNMKKMREMVNVLSSKYKPNLYLRGPAAGGKNTLVYLLAALSKWPVHLMSLNYTTTPRQLIALQTYGEGGKESNAYRLSPVVEAAQSKPRGAWGVLDEVNKPANPGVLSSLFSLLEHRFVSLPNGSVVIAKPGYRMLAMGNPDRPPYITSSTPIDFQRRFQFVEFDYLHAPKRANETDAQVDQRLKELQFLMRLQAPWLYSQNPSFFHLLTLFAQDVVEAFEVGLLPRPMTVRALLRLVRHLENYPMDIKDFMHLLGHVYNVMRLDEHQIEIQEGLVRARFPGVLPGGFFDAPSSKSIMRGSDRDLRAVLTTKKQNGVSETYYQIVDNATPDKKVLAEYPVSDDRNVRAPVGRMGGSPEILRNKLEVLKAISLGEHPLIYGHTGVGKTSVVLDLLTNDLRLKPYHIQLNADSTVSDLWGRQVMQDGKTVWEPSPVILAMQEGRPVVVDDIGKPRHQAVISALNNILQFGAVTTPYGMIKAKPGFFVVSATVPEQARYAANELSGEVEDRHYLIYFGWPPVLEIHNTLSLHHPQLDRDFLLHFAQASDDLHEKEAESGELERPITIEDLNAALDRFQKAPKQTLFQIFLSANGIDPQSEFAAVVKDVLDKYGIADKTYSQFQPPPTVEDIVAEKNPAKRLGLVAHYLRSFKGPQGQSGFHVTFVARRLTVEPVRTSKVSYTQIEIPKKMTALKLLQQLLFVREFRDQFTSGERKHLQEIFDRLIAPPVKVDTGVQFLDEAFQSMVGSRDMNLVRLNLLSAAAFIQQNGLPREAEYRQNLDQLLRWIRIDLADLTPEETQEAASQVSNAIKKSGARSELRDLKIPVDHQKHKALAGVSAEVAEFFEGRPNVRSELRRALQPASAPVNGRVGIGFSWSLTRAISVPVVAQFAKMSDGLVGVTVGSDEDIVAIRAENDRLPEGKKIYYAKSRSELRRVLRIAGAQHSIYYTNGVWERAQALREGFEGVQVFSATEVDHMRTLGTSGLFEKLQRYQQITAIAESGA